MRYVSALDVLNIARQTVLALSLNTELTDNASGSSSCRGARGRRGERTQLLQPDERWRSARVACRGAEQATLREPEGDSET